MKFKTLTRLGGRLGAFLTVLLCSLPVLAGEGKVIGAATPWQIGMGESASPVHERLVEFHDMLLWIITAISVFVLILMIYIFLRFNQKANPTPSKTTHNFKLEVIWTVIPVVILIFIGVPSVDLLRYMDKVEKPEMTLKVTGNTWFWSYEYPDHDGIAFDAIMIPDEEIGPGQKRLLETDNRVVLPIDTDIQILVTTNDVLHSWAVPAFGIKTDAIPGKFHETWVNITKPGVYYGQCSELCGTGHAFMPITIEAVTKEEFKKWVELAKLEFGQADTIFNDKTEYAFLGSAE